jgi:hypothetical protein
MSTLLAILLNILIAAVLYIILNRKIDQQLSPKEMLDRIRDEVEEIIKELNHTTDRNIGLIEDRIETLKGVLETVDKRLTLLRREAERHEVSSAVYTSILSRNRKSPGANTDTSADDASTSGAGAGGKPSAADSLFPEPSSAPAGGRKTGGIPADPAPRRRDFKAEVLDLHRKGISAAIIASRLSSTLGEVELVISLQDGRINGPSEARERRSD